MSRDSKETRAKALPELAREFRQFYGLGASFFRVAAARTGKTVTDMQVMEILDSVGPTTAGRLAELTGLTTGAITGLLNRLEEAGLVRRERDPEDGRRIIVQLERGKDAEQRTEMDEISATFDPLWTSWEQMASGYSDEQVAFLLEFLKGSNAISRREIARLQEAPAGEGKVYAAPLGGLERAQLVVSSGVSMVTLRADSRMTDLYRARFEGPRPEVRTKEGVVSIRYTKRLTDWVTGGPNRIADVTLNTAVPWQILIKGGAAGITADLGSLDLAGFEFEGGVSTMYLKLPTPSRVVPIRIKGSASEIQIRRPAGVAARVHLKGWASHFVFDEQLFSNMGNDIRMQSPGFEAAAAHYSIEVLSSASTVTITSA